ncbi:hypothetical protein PQR75_40690 [Paraburkholderia fungorum]
MTDIGGRGDRVARAVASSLDPAQALELCTQTTHATDVSATTSIPAMFDA